MATNRKPRPYHSLVERNEDGVWGVQFGDYDRAVVVQERKDSFADVKLADIKIIRTATDDQAAIDAVVAELNAIRSLAVFATRVNAALDAELIWKVSELVAGVGFFYFDVADCAVVDFDLVERDGAVAFYCDINRNEFDPATTDVEPERFASLDAMAARFVAADAPAEPAGDASPTGWPKTRRLVVLCPDCGLPGYVRADGCQSSVCCGRGFQSRDGYVAATALPMNPQSQTFRDATVEDLLADEIDPSKELR